MARRSLDQRQRLSYDEVHTMFLDRMGEITETGAEWVACNVDKRMLVLNRLKTRLVNTLDTRIDAGLARTGLSSSHRQRGVKHYSPFARVADVFDADTKEKLEKAKEEVVDTAKDYRVPVPAANLPYIGYVHSLTIKQLLCGVIAGAVASTVVVPFDVLQSKVIAGQGGRSLGQVVSTVAREEGLQSLMKGSLNFNIIKNGIEKGLQFTIFEAVKRNQQRKKGKQPKVLPIPRAIPLSTAGGAAAGFIGTLLSYPLQPVFSRCLLQPEKYNSMIGTLKTIVKNEGGIRELYRGIVPALMSMVPSAAISFYTYETLKNKYVAAEHLQNPQALASLIIGGIAGAVSSTITFPLEEARRQIVYSTLSKEAVNIGNVHYNNTWQALQGIVKRDGFRGLYRGLTPTILQIVPMTAITFMVYEFAKRALIAQGEESPHEVLDASDLPPEEQSKMP
ncbi:hypothetical protein MPTK1_7g12620 [Marchantia polymorpha subsp. ruderalis]|uniref:Uncharacterized protein n=2 Tax=Marchantia polymorpha TaxID=3197 RepID=A0A176WMN7_MARPO|nr:hypothetical protein AXG93_4875s1380 [Marchantia polymorpha subsp. ruderalis]PTQ49416.1 hypothetical protein MARPO_0003s0270 [Marchantia polymorpha]BBN17181.1 hypothetical protein Mp_7g12620 [Marchantia polymorpha subsp. ruderalis]|eukprot:PTQ49416.1 hypothetical protein MARPO_0003s0270 [Marchantia polymorpha]